MANQKITTLNFDDIIREKKKAHSLNGGKVGTCEIYWNKEGESVLRRFGIRNGSMFLGATHHYEDSNNI